MVELSTGSGKITPDYIIWRTLRQTGMRRVGTTTTEAGRMDALDPPMSAPTPAAYSFMRNRSPSNDFA